MWVSDKIIYGNGIWDGEDYGLNGKKASVETFMLTIQ